MGIYLKLKAIFFAFSIAILLDYSLAQEIPGAPDTPDATATQLNKENQERSDTIDEEYDLNLFGMDAEALKESEGGTDILINFL